VPVSTQTGCGSATAGVVEKATLENTRIKVSNMVRSFLELYFITKY
jgi:hypothetical protein